MPDIGSTLRETRMRRRIDIVEVESHTKIRAKYLRALENEEWDLLPGPTFVKTFLRTYGDYLGLDSKMLVEEYKQRFERPRPQDLMPFSQRAGAARRQRRAMAIPPFALVALVVVVVLGALFAVGKFGDDPADDPSNEATATATPAPEGERRTAAERRRARKRREQRAAAATVPLRIIPTGTVNVCLVSAAGKRLIDSENLTAGGTTRLFRSKRLRVTFGNGQARMRVGTRVYDVADSDGPVGYELRPGRKPRPLGASARPVCS